MPAWNGWHHCMSGTYGSWLPGDPRGFRTRDHRVHIDGDYKQPPPPGKYDAWHEHARSIMSRDAVTLSAEARHTALAVMLQALVRVHQIEILAISVSGQHFHMLARFGKLPPEQTPPDSQKPTDLIRGLPIGSAGLRENDPALLCRHRQKGISESTLGSGACRPRRSLGQARQDCSHCRSRTSGAGNAVHH